MKIVKTSGNANDGLSLTSAEIQLIQAFRTMSAAQARMLLDTARSAASRQKAKPALRIVKGGAA